MALTQIRNVYNLDVKFSPLLDRLGEIIIIGTRIIKVSNLGWMINGRSLGGLK